MKLLLLGAGGQLGSDLRRTDQSLAALRRRDVDVTHDATLRRVLRDATFDVLINATAYNRVDDAESHVNEAMRANAHAVRIMAEICAERGKRFVHVSTDYVFNGQRDQPYVETNPTAPLSVYGRSKAEGERLALAAHDDVVIFRVASLFGVAGSSGKGGNFVETMIRVGTERGKLRVVHDQIMSPTCTADVASAMLKALDADIAPGIYHLVNQGEASWYDFACRIIEQAGVHAQVEAIPAAEYPTAAQRPAYSVLDACKISAVIGPMPHWTDALSRYLKTRG
jgi:dTDP-4-dehydrorhamnose reductase